jgi:enoyl-[acyl-carrier protein] reductase I
MGFLQDRRILVTGMLSNRSIAYGIAKACRREGAELAFTYQGEGVRERVAELAREFGADRVLPCDVADDAQIEALFVELGKSWDGLDGVVHAIAFAPREAQGPFHERVARLPGPTTSPATASALAKAAMPMMQGRRGAIVTLTYWARRAPSQLQRDGARQASLEAGVRYLGSMGPLARDAISARPIKTLAAAGIGGSRRSCTSWKERALATRGHGRGSGAPAPSCSPTWRAASPARSYVDAGFNHHRGTGDDWFAPSSNVLAP